jgi:hypothetical protein
MSKFSASATSIQNIDLVLKNLREAIDNLVALGKDGGSNTHLSRLALKDQAPEVTKTALGHLFFQ